MESEIAVALIAAAVALGGWVAPNILQRQMEDRKRRLEARAGYLQRQIEELYGPLFNLTTQIVTTNHVLHGLRTAPNQTDAERVRVEDIFHKEFFQPLHTELRNLLKSRLHLVDGSRLPQSFYAYLRASIQEGVQRSLWREHQINTAAVAGQQYPDEFTWEVRETLERLLLEHESAILGLQSPGPIHTATLDQTTGELTPLRH